MMYLFVGMILLLCVLLLILGLLHRKNAVEKIYSMNRKQKCDLMENLIFPFGYTYIKNQDFFSSSMDAWQKRFGYSAFYDNAAAPFHMVFDALPVYFDYQDYTWLIEFWKGQYGIHTGCEIGVYHSEKILKKEEYDSELFHAVPESEMLPLSFRLIHKDHMIAELHKTHWWLTAFLPGYYANPEELVMEASVTFPNSCMASAFVNALEAKGYDVSICGLKICFTFSFCQECRFSRIKKLHRRMVQWMNHLLCHLFLHFTKPFVCSLDRVLFLFECLPFSLHRMFQIHHSPKKVVKRL